MASEAYETVNKAWKSTCRTVLGEEIGELNGFEDYLKEGLIGKTGKSHYSGKNLWVVSDDYCPNARFFDYGKEREEYEKIMSKPIDINKIKDLDSLLEAINEKLVYSGNKVLGNSKYVEDSDSIVDSTNILNSSLLVGNKCVAYSYLLQHSEYSFGATSSGQSDHVIRCFYNNSLKRCFEVSTSVGISDCYFTYNVMNSSDCMFSFNLRGKRHMIANIQLNKEEYTKLKNKLLEEIRDELRKKKRLDFCIIDVINGWAYD